MTQHLFERNGLYYFCTPLEVAQVEEEEVEAFAFAQALKDKAPNGNILWLRGSYVEADRPNTNGDMWEASELAASYKSTQYMPVTVMHDTTSAVGLIADVQLKTPENDGVARSRVETILAIWAHRFPKIAAEVLENDKLGTLMQSMECRAKVFSLDPELNATDVDEDVRILRDVTFTGTGLIFGSRGSKGAYDEAHLEVFEERVADHHASVHKSNRKGSSRPVSMIQVEPEKYEALLARPSVEDFTAAERRAEAAESEAEATAKRVEELEAAEKKLTDERDNLAKELKETKEEIAAEQLKGDRLGKLGSGFLAKLGDSTKDRLERQAKEMSDEDWADRIAEVEELAGVKSDLEASEKTDDEFTEKEVQASALGDEGGTGPDLSDREFGSAMYELAGV